MYRGSSEFLGLSQKQFIKAIQLISHIVPRQFTSPRIIHQHLVRQGMILKGIGLFSLDEIQSAVEEKIGLKLELFEIQAALHLLIKSNEVVLRKVQKLIKTGEKVIGQIKEEKYQLTRRAYKLWVTKNNQKEEFENQVIEDWIQGLSNVYSLSDDEISWLRLDLRTYTVKLLQTHGLECSTLLYPEQEETRANEFLQNVSKEILSYLPTAGRSRKIIHIRSLEIPRFFEKADHNRKVYIAELLDSTFLYHVLHLDTTCSNIIKTQIRGITLYLDTNFLYRLFGLHGRSAQKAAEAVLSISEQMGMKPLVAKRTVDEYKRALEHDIKELRQYKLPSTKRLAEIGGILGGADDFITAYWRRYAETGISINDFVSIYRQVESFLRNQKVTIDYESDCTDSAELEQEIKKLSSFIYEYNDLFRSHPRRRITKKKGALKHDAYLHLLVSKKREDKTNTFAQTKAWLLTYDHSLIIYDYYRKVKGIDQGSSMNISIMAHQWVQLFRPLLPRTADYNATFADLLCSPYLRSYPKSIPPHVVAQVLAVGPETVRYGPQMALILLTDMFFVQQMAKVTDEEQEKKIIKEAIQKAAREAEAEQALLPPTRLRQKKRTFLRIVLSLLTATGVFFLGYIFASKHISRYIQIPKSYMYFMLIIFIPAIASIIYIIEKGAKLWSFIKSIIRHKNSKMDKIATSKKGKRR